MTINSKTKATVIGLLTDNDTTESEFKTGLTDVCEEIDDLYTIANGAVGGVIAGDGLTGGGDTGTVTVSLSNTGPGAGTYGSTSDTTKIDTITLDKHGRVTAIATGTGGDILGVTAGSGLTGGGTSGTVTVSHADTSSQSSVNNSNGTVIQDVTIDTYGHVTGLSSVNLDSRYYTESESNARYPRLLATYNTGYVGDGANGDYTYTFTAPLNANSGSSDPDSVPLIIISHNYWTFFSSQNCEYKIKEARFDRTGQDIEIVVNINGGGQTWPHTLYFQMYGIDI